MLIDPMGQEFDSVHRDGLSPMPYLEPHLGRLNS
jgi:hypothetical protein